jgi:ribosomal protein S18 acetylase RimI-like enzyme
MPTLSYEIRPAFAEHAAAIHHVRKEGWLYAYADRDHRISLRDIEIKFRNPEWFAKLRERLVNPPPNNTVLVAEMFGAVIGFCEVTLEPDHNKVNGLYVTPMYIGRGVGTALWNAVQKSLDPCLPTFVWVVTYNRSAIEFYKKLGFKPTCVVDRAGGHKMSSGAVIPELQMRRMP